MSLTSASTDQEIHDAYFDNASYEADNSKAKALAFVTACRFILLKRPMRMKHENQEVEVDLSLIANEMKAARRWAATKQSSGMSYGSFQYFRD